jgi:hypothetical protein
VSKKYLPCDFELVASRMSRGKVNKNAKKFTNNALKNAAKR